MLILQYNVHNVQTVCNSKSGYANSPTSYIKLWVYSGYHIKNLLENANKRVSLEIIKYITYKTN